MKEKILKFKVSEPCLLRDELVKNLSRKFYRHLKSVNAEILVDSIRLKNFEAVKPGQIITIKYQENEKECDWPLSESLPNVIFENEHYLVVNKEAGILTIPTKANPNSLYQQLVTYLGTGEVHILNRLDKDTSGLVVVAKDRYAASKLMPTHLHMERRYKCLVEGIVDQDGTVTNYLKKDLNSNKRYVTSDDTGQLAISNYKVHKYFDDKTLLEFILDTGRTHQIRVHCLSIGHPIIGDTLYGNTKADRMYLVSYYVEFMDPFINEVIKIEIDEDWTNGR